MSLLRFSRVWEEALLVEHLEGERDAALRFMLGRWWYSHVGVSSHDNQVICEAATHQGVAWGFRGVVVVVAIFPVVIAVFDFAVVDGCGQL